MSLKNKRGQQQIPFETIEKWSMVLFYIIK